MSEKTTETASKPEESETVAQAVDSATTEEQPSGEAQTAEINETATQEKGEEASESAQQPVDSELEKANKAAEKSHTAAAKANIKNRKLERKIAQMEAANTQEPIQKAEPDAEVPEDILYDADKTAGYIKSTVDTAILKDRKEQDEIRQTNAANQERETFWEKSDELAESDDEYSELVEASDDVQMSNILRGRLIKSEVGAKLHKHVLANPDVLLKINNLSLQYPKAANDEIAKIEASLADKSQGHEKSIKETNAPKVIETAGGGGGPVLTSADAGSMDEYYDRRMQEKAVSEAVHAQ